MDMSHVTFAGRSVAVAAVAVVTATVLTGCIPVNGPVAIGALNGEFRVAVCEELIVEGAYASVREPGQDWKRMWEADGQVTIPSGAIVNLVNDSFGMELGLYREPSFSAGSRVSFTFLGNPDPNTGTIASFTVPQSGVEDGLWLTPDGEVQQTPCE
jgi:hypothetical protein